MSAPNHLGAKATDRLELVALEREPPDEIQVSHARGDLVPRIMAGCVLHEELCVNYVRTPYGFTAPYWPLKKNDFANTALASMWWLFPETRPN